MLRKYKSFIKGGDCSRLSYRIVTSNASVGMLYGRVVMIFFAIQNVQKKCKLNDKNGWKEIE